MEKQLSIALANEQEKIKLINILSNIMGRIINDEDTTHEDIDTLAHLIHKLCDCNEVTLDLRRNVQSWQINTAGITNFNV